MARGGKRDGSGRKPGVANQANQEARDRAAAGGEMPLDYMLRVMRTTDDGDRADRMAIGAAPYCHSKLAQTDINAKLALDGSITFTWKPPQES